MGKFSVDEGATSHSQCLHCPAHSSSEAGSDTPSACVCNAGYTGADGEACEACAAGKYKIVVGSPDCTQCPDGTYSDKVAATSNTCVRCSADSYSSLDMSQCVPCPQHASSPAGSSASDSCLCNAGYTGANGEACSVCRAGTYKQEAGSNGCTDCAAGTFSAASAVTSPESCVECGVNSYPDVGSEMCLKCPAGKLAPRGSATISECKTSCPAGFEGEPGACSMCTTNTYNPMENGQCQPCPANALSEEGSTFCECAPGYAFVDATCKLCLAGRYKAQVGNVSCEICEAGSYSGAEGATSASACVACPPHSTSPAGATHVTQCSCLPGYSKDGLSTDSSSTDSSSPSTVTCVEDVSSHCELECPENHYRKLCRCTACEACPPGKHRLGCGGNDEGSCAECPADFFKANDGPSECAPCGEGFGSLPGWEYCCPIGTRDSSGEWARCYCPKGMYGVDGKCVKCKAGTYRQDEYSNVCLACPKHMDSAERSMAEAECTCKSGYVPAGADGRRCRKRVQDTPVVEVAVALPMTKASFQAQEDSFISALAGGAGVPESAITVVSVTEINSRRTAGATLNQPMPAVDAPSRKLLATSVQVTSEIETPSPADVSLSLTQESLDAALAEAGLPEATSIAISVRQPGTAPVPSAKSDSPPAAPPAMPAHETSSQDTGLIGGICAGGIALLLIAVAVYWFKRKSDEAGKAADVEAQDGAISISTTTHGKTVDVNSDVVFESTGMPPSRGVP